VPEARRVGPAGDEADDLAAGWDQVVPADVLFDPRAQRRGVHRRMLAAWRRAPRRSDHQAKMSER
jgi:hypothetical protein